MTLIETLKILIGYFVIYYVLGTIALCNKYTAPRMYNSYNRYHNIKDMRNGYALYAVLHILVYIILYMI